MWKFITTLLLVLTIAVRSQDVAAPVKVTTYYETLCPDSVTFFTTQLEPTYNELSDIMVVDDYAYGFITESPLGSGYNFSCQHGPDECYGNKVVSCGRTWIADHETFLKFEFCVMGAPYPPFAGTECAQQFNIPYFPIGNCANTTQGELLLHDNGLKQAGLDPTVTYVPWIIINDEFSQVNLIAAQADLKRLVCTTYQGTPPPACLAVLHEERSKIKVTHLI